jgi:hypothetical protein
VLLLGFPQSGDYVTYKASCRKPVKHFGHSCPYRAASLTGKALVLRIHIFRKKRFCEKYELDKRNVSLSKN